MTLLVRPPNAAGVQMRGPLPAPGSTGAFVTATSFNFLLMTVCGWVNRRQQATIEYLREENRVLREQLGFGPDPATTRCS